MRNIHKQFGFSAVELLITLFVAAAFLISGYQLYAVVIEDGGDARAQNKAANVANDYIQQVKPNAKNPCVSGQSSPYSDSGISPQPEGLSNATISVTISCPYGTSSTVSKITATIKYNAPQQTLNSATYVYSK